ncbi:MAG: hypothetical protein JJE04_18975 [Acidobacteriia bacterium]|nr:hypothetical protein [Terriglobia bacterium]
MQYRRANAGRSDEELLARLPEKDAVQVVINVQVLRQAGVLDMLAGSRAAEETEYKNFVRDSGFNYREDLDTIFASFVKANRYFLLRGRFDWPQLRNYALTRGGSCKNGFCTLAMEANRHVSFFPVSPSTLALAISENPQAAYDLTTPVNHRAGSDLPRHPFWILIPSSVLQGGSLPTGTRAFASAVKQAERIVLSLDTAPDGFQALLHASCRNAQEADTMANQLTAITQTLLRYIEREKHTPNPLDLSGVLTSGTFRRQDKDVLGQWPIHRGFLESVAGGKY